MNFFEEIAPIYQGKTVLVAFHATALRYFCAKVMGFAKADIVSNLPLCENAALTYVDYQDGKFTVNSKLFYVHEVTPLEYAELVAADKAQYEEKQRLECKAKTLLDVITEKD